MMKKILTFVLGLFLVIGLTACDSNDDDNEKLSN